MVGTVRADAKEDVLLKGKVDVAGLLKENKGNVVAEARAGVVVGAGADTVKAIGVDAAARATAKSLPRLLHRQVQLTNQSTPESKHSTKKGVQKVSRQFKPVLVSHFRVRQACLGFGRDVVSGDAPRRVRLPALPPRLRNQKTFVSHAGCHCRGRSHLGPFLYTFPEHCYEKRRVGLVNG